MTKKKVKTPYQLAEEHWEYTGTLLKIATGLKPDILNIMGFLYIQSFIHGYKHGKDNNNATTTTRT